jgi:hypothetical protein
MKRIIYVTTFLTLILFHSCKNQGKENSTNQTTISPPVDVYVVGNVQTQIGSNSKAVLWINDVPTFLTDGTHQANAGAVTLSGSDVYVVGYESNGTHNIAKYWKNGNEVILSDGSNDAQAQSIYIEGNDVYVAGYESNGTHNIAKYWKNGTPHDLTDGTNEGYTTSIFVLNNHIFVLTVEYDGTNFIAKVWKDGSSTTLNGTYTNVSATSIYVSGSDVYIAGNIMEFNNWRAVLWKNGVISKIFNGTLSSWAASVNVYSNSVYIGGYRTSIGDGSSNTNRGFIKKDSNIKYITSEDDSTIDISSIMPIETDVYSAGSVGNGGFIMAAYWKNSEIHYLSSDHYYGRVNSIFIKRK